MGLDGNRQKRVFSFYHIWLFSSSDKAFRYSCPHARVATVKITVQQTDFDPYGLVTKALKTGEKNQFTEIISYDELAQENSLSARILAQDVGIDPATKPNFLIRYTITPIRNGKAEMVGALISGDVVKQPIVNKTLSAFNNGYSAVYLYQNSGEFSLATAQLLNSKGIITQNPNLPNNKILEKAIDAQGEVVTQVISINNKTHTVAAKALFNYENQPIGVLLRGTPHQA